MQPWQSCQKNIVQNPRTFRWKHFSQKHSFINDLECSIDNNVQSFWTKFLKGRSKGEQIYKTKKYKGLHPQLLFLDTKNAISTNIPKVYGRKTDKCSVKVRQKNGELVLYQKQKFTPKKFIKTVIKKFWQPLSFSASVIRKSD